MKVSSSSATKAVRARSPGPGPSGDPGAGRKVGAKAEECYFTRALIIFFLRVKPLIRHEPPEEGAIGEEAPPRPAPHGAAEEVTDGVRMHAGEDLEEDILR